MHRVRSMPRLAFVLGSCLGLAACESQLMLSASPSGYARPSISPLETVIADPGDVLPIKGKNLSSKISVFVNDERTQLTIIDEENASLTLPEGGDSDLFRLSFKIADQTINSFSLAKSSAIAGLPNSSISTEFLCDDLIFKDQNGVIARGERQCASSPTKACKADGEVNCTANDEYKAAATAGAAQKISTGETLAGIAGSAAVKPAECASDGESNCVVDGVRFKAAKLALFSANDVRSSVQVAGVQGNLPNCSFDGELGCRVVGPSFAAAQLTGASAKILSGQSLGGIPGSALPVPANCSMDNESGCVATPAFPAVVKADVSAGLIKAGTIIAGVTGAYPSSTYPLASSTATNDLTMFQSQLTSNAGFEFFDSAGVRYTGSGDADLVAANIRSGVAFENLSINGTMPAILPLAPATLTAMFFTSPDRMILNWTAVSGAAGYMLIARAGAAVTFTPTRNQTYVPGAQGSDTILYVGTDLTFVHSAIVSGNSYNYALYSYDANHFYSSVPTRTINTSQFCQGLAGGSWVAVPGDATYGTNDFCVQKFEAKDVGGIATSQAALAPWAGIAQASAVISCRALGSTYDIISNAEWLTIGANIAQVASNWSSGTVGVGYVNRGHSDSNPNSACAASSDDTLAWVQTDCTPKNSSGDVWIQKRTHTLSTGGVIWDLSGNVWDATDFAIPDINAKPYVSTDGAPMNAWREYTAIDAGFTSMTRGELTPTNAQKAFWNNNWASSTFGMGRYYPGLNGSGNILIRGGYWTDNIDAGLFAGLFMTTSGLWNAAGFRCVARPPTL
jgi:hypothetical protein